MTKHLFSALFLIIPVSLSLTVFAQSVESVQQSPFSAKSFGAVVTDSIPVKKSARQVIPTTTRQTKINADSVSQSGIYKNYDPTKLKASSVDTTGFIYDLNAFYYLGK